MRGSHARGRTVAAAAGTLRTGENGSASAPNTKDGRRTREALWVSGVSSILPQSEREQSRTAWGETGDKRARAFLPIDLLRGVDDVVGAARRLLGVLNARLEHVCEGEPHGRSGLVSSEVGDNEPSG